MYTALAAGARLIRDMSFPHQVARRLCLDYGLQIAQFRPRVGKHSQSPKPWLKPQQAELLAQAEEAGAFVLTRTKALGDSPWALLFPQELPNEDLLEQVLPVLRARGLLREGE